MVMSGVVLSVDVVEAGVDVLEPAAVSDSFVVGVDALDVPTTGGVVELPDGSVVDVVSADHDTDVLTFAVPLLVALVEGDRLLVRPRSSYTEAVVEIEGEGGTVPVRVPHTMQSSMPVGVREGDRESVTVEVREDGSFWILDVHDRPPLEVWGDPLGVAMEMRDTGLTAYTAGAAGRYPASTFGSGQDRLGVFNADGQIVGGVTADGQLVGQSGAIAGDMSVGGVPLMGRLWDNSPGAPIGWLDRFSAGLVVNAPFAQFGQWSSSGQELGYAKVAFSARAGRAYKVTVYGWAVTDPGLFVLSQIRYTTSVWGEPTVSSSILPGTGSTVSTAASSSGGAAFRVEAVHVESVDTTVTLMLTHRVVGATHRGQSAYFLVEDAGPQGVYGGGTYTTGRETTPPPTVREYASTWTATDFRVYDGTGQPDATKTAPYQWGIGSAPTPDRSFTALLFDGPATAGSDVGSTITAAQTGATITKAEVFLTNTQWALIDAGEVALGKGGFASLPLTLAPQATVKPRDWPTGAGMWVEVPTSWFNDTNRVVTLGDVDQSVNGGWFMSPTDDFPPQVRLTYVR